MYDHKYRMARETEPQLRRRLARVPDPTLRQLVAQALWWDMFGTYDCRSYDRQEGWMLDGFETGRRATDYEAYRDALVAVGYTKGRAATKAWSHVYDGTIKRPVKPTGRGIGRSRLAEVGR